MARSKIGIEPRGHAKCSEERTGEEVQPAAAVIVLGHRFRYSSGIINRLSGVRVFCDDGMGYPSTY